MVDSKNVSVVEAWELTLRNVSVLLRLFDRNFRDEIGIPLTWYDVLVTLFWAPDRRMRIQTLSETVVLARPGMTRLVDSMQASGLVRREAASEDRRGYYAVMTAEGEKMFERATTYHLKDLEDNLGQYLTRKDLVDLYRVMKKLTDGNPQFLGKRSEA